MAIIKNPISIVQTGGSTVQNLEYKSDVTIIYSLIEDAIETLRLPDSVTTLQRYAFEGLDAENLIIGSSSNCSLTLISEHAFRGAEITNLVIYATTPPTLYADLDDDDYADIDNIFVPAGSVSAYQSATNWSAYASIIQAIP